MTNALDKILDLVGSAGAAVSVIALANPASGIPVWLAIAGTVIAMATGRAASKGVPLYSSFKPGQKDARGQVADAEEPK